MVIPISDFSHPYLMSIVSPMRNYKPLKEGDTFHYHLTFK